MRGGSAGGQTRPTTLNALYFDSMARHGGALPALRSKHGDTWAPISYRDLHRRVRNLQAALRTLGIGPGDRVAILSENRPEWAITDFACLSARCTDVPIYPTLPPHQIAYVLRDSGSRIVFCSDETQLEKLLEIRETVPALEQIVVFDAMDVPDGVREFADVERLGAEAIDDFPDWEAEALAATPDDLATLIYTSGTTGDPKGVMLTHGNITSNVVASLQVLELRAGDECLSFLPLSHIFERMVGHYTNFYAGVVINYATSIDAVGAETREVHPTVMASVPRLYEKIYARVVDAATHGSGLNRAIFEWARATGEKCLNYRLAQQRVPAFLRVANWFADLLVFRRIRRLLGGRLRFFVSGGAPLNPEICRFFLAAGLPILEGYGLTETSPVITVNRMAKIKPGTVGSPIPGVEVMIAEDGEILTRGPHVMKGYFGKPEATAAAIDSDGWFHTGDIGMIDADGYLRITDRKKDIIVTAGGKNIAPQPIEALLKTNGYLVNAVMIGDRRRFPSMLLVPNFRVLRSWAKIKELPNLTDEELVRRPEVQEKLEREARKSLRDLAHYEMPKKFLILPRDFSIETGELTPKMSIKRKVVEEQWRDQIEAMYAEDDA